MEVIKPCTPLSAAAIGMNGTMQTHFHFNYSIWEGGGRKCMAVAVQSPGVGALGFDFYDPTVPDVCNEILFAGH